MLRTVHAARYVLPLREGGSMPALMEAGDDGLYAVKLRGAGQGAKALVAELIAGELARAAGLPVPEIVLVELSGAFAASEPDPEIAHLLEASTGLNLGLDYLPGSVNFDPVAGPWPDTTLASRTVLFDAFVTNVDRTPRNPNLLTWHNRLWLIDHGAALFFHHGWDPSDRLDGSRDPFALIAQHVLLRSATALPDAAAHLAATLSDATLERVVQQIPSSFLSGDRSGDRDFPDDEAHRAAYLAWLRARAAALPIVLEEAQRAHALRV